MKTSKIAIRVCQALLLVVGIFWVCFSCTTHLDYAQFPGFLIAMAISWWLTPEIRSRAMKLGLVDKPGEERRIHKDPIPRLGGVAIYISVMLTMGILIALTGRFPKDARGYEGGLAGIAVGGTLIFVLGLLDDLESIPAKVKLLVQFLAATASYSLGVRIKTLPIPWNWDAINLGFMQIPLDNHALSLGWLSFPLTVFWLVGIANAVNLIDGMDGLAAGVSAISAITVWSVSVGALDRPYAGLLAAILAGALLGFLRWNFNPARIFLGDSGAYLVGFVLAAISIMGVIKGATVATVVAPTFVLVVLILFFPILDTSWAIVRRVAKRKSIFEPDAGHIHHRLLQAGLSQKKVAYLIYFVSACFGLLAAACVHQEKYFLMLVGVVLTMAIFFAEVLNRHRQRPHKKKAVEGSSGQTSKANGSTSTVPNASADNSRALPPNPPSTSPELKSNEPLKVSQRVADGGSLPTPNVSAENLRAMQPNPTVGSQELKSGHALKIPEHEDSV